MNTIQSTVCVPTGLMIQLSNTPLSIQTEAPLMTWCLPPAFGMQKAYRILVATAPELLQEEKGDVWDSGRVEGQENSHVPYAGKALMPDSIYWWAVSLWNDAGEQTAFSEPRFFSTEVGDHWDGAKAIWCGKSEAAKAYQAFYEAAAGPGDFLLECDYTIEAGKLDFLVHKRENNEEERNGYLIRLSHDKVRGFRVTEGMDDSILWLGSCALSDSGPGATHHLRIVSERERIHVEVDGARLLTLENCYEYPRGFFGIRTDAGDSAAVKNLVFTDLSKKKEDLCLSQLVLKDGVKFYHTDPTRREDLSKLPQKNNIVFFRKPFTLPNKPIRRALASAVALSRQGILQYTFKLYLNGKCVGLGSPRSMEDSNAHLYSTFDLTEGLTSGENVIGAISYTLFDQRFALRLKIFYEDGSQEVISTDESWKTLDGTLAFGDDGSTIVKYGTSAYAMADNLNGLYYPFGWNTAGYDDSKWEKPLIKEDIPSLRPSPLENMMEYPMPVKEIVDLGQGHYLITLEREIIGGLSLTIDVPKTYAGTCMTVLCGEELEGEYRVKWMMRTRNTYREFWTLGEGKQTLENYSMKGFRYVELQNCPVTLKKEMLCGLAYRQGFCDSDASFACSEPILNDIFALCQYAMKATNQDIYTDSQTRERADNDAGDAYVNVKTAHAVSRNYTLSRFTAKYMDSISHRITEYNIHAILTAWTFYRYTGDKTIIEEDYHHFTRLLQTDRIDPEVGLYWFQTDREFRDLVDWPHAERDNYQLFDCYYNTVVNSYHYKGMCVVAEIAEILGKTEDAENYRRMAATLKANINRYFYNVNGDGLYIEGMKKDGTPVTGTAAPANLYPLLHGVIDDKEAAATVLAYVAKRGITGSVFGAQFLLEALYANEAGERALELLTDRGLRSWYHVMYELGATITTEAWDPTLKANMTFSHPWGSAAGNALMEGLAGITPIVPGFDRIRIKPQIGSLEWVNVKMPTVKGAVEMKIKRHTGQNATEMTVKIPGNTTATVYVPCHGSDRMSATVDGRLRAAQKVTEQLLIYHNIGAGEHSFLLEQD